MEQVQSQPQSQSSQYLETRTPSLLETLSGQSASIHIFLFGPFEIRQAMVAKEEQTKERRTSAHSLLKLLLCAPQRQAPKAQLAGILWPETEEQKARESLRAAVKALIRFFPSTEGKLLEAPQREILKLADHARIWADMDAFEQAVRIANELTSPQEAISVWQYAYRIVRGEFLAEDQLQPWIKQRWIKQRQKRLWLARCRTIRNLADLYLSQGHANKAEEILEHHITLFPLDQDALARFLALLIRQGCPDEAHTLYQQASARLAALGKCPSDQVKAIMKGATKATDQFTSVLHNEKAGRSSTQENPTATSSSFSSTTPWYPQMNTGTIPRRQVLHYAVELGSTALITPSEDMLSSFLDRFTRILASPSRLDTSTLHYLERQIRNYWLDRQSGSVASCDLLSYVWDNLQKILRLLESTLPPNTRQHLCALASKTALLTGELLLDMSNYGSGRQCHETAIVAAREARDPSLEAIAWGRKGLAWIYEKQMKEALACAQRARTLTSHPTIKAWLAAIEAEAWAGLLHPEDCLRALDDAASTLNLPQSSSDDLYLIHFDRALLRAYEGACYRRLYQVENPHSLVFSRKAQDVLTEALLRLDATSAQRRPTFLIDLADTYVQQEEIEAACAKAIEALTLASQLKLQKVLLRATSIQQQLHPWEDTPAVHLLEEHMTTILPANIRQI